MAAISTVRAIHFSAFIFALVVSSAIMAIVTGGLAQALDARDAKYGPPSQSKAQLWGDDFCSYWDKRGGGYVGDMVWVTGRDGTKNIYAYEGDTTAPVRVNAGGRYCSLHSSSTQVYGHYYDDLGTISNNNTTRYPRIAYPKQAAGTYFNAQKNSSINISSLKAGDHTLCITLDTVYGAIPPQPSPNACSPITLHILQKWTTTGTSLVGVGETQEPNVSSWTTAPGSMLHWRHTITAAGGTTPGLAFAIGKSGFTANAWGDGSDPNHIEPQGTTSAIAKGSSYSIGWGANSPSYSEYRVRQSDVGNTLCQSISWGPRAYNNSEWRQSSPACVSVPYDFNLSPSVEPIEGSVNVVVEPGATISTVRPKVSNSGPTKSYDNTAWQLSRIVVNPGVTPPAGTDNSTDPCVYYRAGGSTCTNEASADDRTFGTGDTIINQLNNIAVGDMAAGQKLCFALSVQKYDVAHPSNNGQWRHSTPMCVTIGKKPKVQVWGGDLSVGRRFAGDITTPNDSSVNVSTSSKDNKTKTFGSWVEYGVFAPRTITGGSSAGLAGSDGNASATQSDWSKLTFANSGHTPITGCNTAVKFGCYAQASSMGVIPSVAARLAPAATNSAPQLNGSVDLTGRNATYYSSGNLTIQASTIAKGNSVIIKAAGTVTIDGNITYTTDSLSSISDIPQVVIIANNIQIKDTVTNVDAWLIANGASGRIYSCNNYDFSQTLTDKTCDKKLVVNGPVMAKKLYLTRTAGSGVGPASGDPGEILNLRADAYLWAINRAQGAGRIQTTETRELAPRF